MFIVPKPDNGVRPIIYLWTAYIVIPYFSLKSNGEAVRQIPPGSYLVKIDLKSGFNQLPLHRQFRDYNLL